MIFHFFIPSVAWPSWQINADDSSVIPLGEVQTTTVLIHVETVRPGQCVIEVDLQSTDSCQILLRHDDPVVTLISDQDTSQVVEDDTPRVL